MIMKKNHPKKNSLKVGDKVEIIKDGLKGTVIEIDNSHKYPYARVRYNKKGIKNLTWNFGFSDLRLIKPVEEKVIEAWAVTVNMGEIRAWFGGDGTRIPVWEDNKIGRKEAKQFLKNNKYHKPKLIKVRITEII